MDPSQLTNFCDRWLAAWSGNRPDELITFYCTDALYRDPARPHGLRGDEILPYFRRLLARNPEWEWRRAELWPIENGFMLKWKAKIPVGVQIVEEQGLDIVVFRDGKIARNEVFFDRAQLVAAATAGG
ncbi:MAG: nuclear transport factor 2 family protein [Deltaproteobacteria bacterium]|nr:nuclear transport factor 2 family protein [Deltaproteobacteria bacterium]